MSELDDLHKLQDAVHSFVTSSRIELPSFGRAVPGTCYPQSDVIVIYTTREAVLRMRVALEALASWKAQAPSFPTPSIPPRSIFDL